jgi:hypothetical protein
MGWEVEKGKAKLLCIQNGQIVESEDHKERGRDAGKEVYA